MRFFIKDSSSLYSQSRYRYRYEWLWFLKCEIFWQTRSNQLKVNLSVANRDWIDWATFFLHQTTFHCCIAVDHEIRVKLHTIILIWDCTWERKNKSASWECCQFKNWRNGDLLSYRHQTTHSFHFPPLIKSKSCSRLNIWYMRNCEKIIVRTELLFSLIRHHHHRIIHNIISCLL